MGFKKYDRGMSFMDIELRRILGKSRTQRLLADMDSHINWKPIDRILVEAYPVGKSEYGNRAYPPLMLLKAVLLQKWFGITSEA